MSVRGSVVVVYADGRTEVAFVGPYKKALEYQRKMLKSLRRRPDVTECRVVAR